MSKEMNVEQARQILELGLEATRQEIKAAYRRAARRWHPDRAPSDQQAEYHARMQEINEAYRYLLNFIDNYRYRLEEPQAAAATADYEQWWHQHFGTMGWPNQVSRRPRRKKEEDPK